jgi:glycosyltransferase involved in cell wall biosynthesis
MSDAIRLSIALVTRNRSDSLRRCLTSLRAQDVQPSEIVLSDDSDDLSAAIAMAEEFGARHIPGPRRGLYANRNAAALACTGTHIRTMDDDHTFPAGHFERCLAALERDPQAVWACDEMSYLDGRFYSSPQPAPQLHPSGVGGPVATPDDTWAIADGSTIYPRTVFDRGLRMVEEYGYGSSYLEFGAYLYHHGFRGRLLRDTFIEHHAEAATLTRGDLRSRLFASLCFNLCFRPNRWSAAKYLLSYAVLRRPALVLELPAMLRFIHARWNCPR